MDKYNVGDKVVIRDDLIVGELYGSYLWIAKMEKFKGEVVTIESKNFDYYMIEEMNCGWTEEMIQGLAKDEKESVDMINNIEVDMELVLKGELDAGLKVFSKGTRAKVVKVVEEKNMAHIKINGDLGVFKFDEVSEYFEEYVEPAKQARSYDGELGEGIARIHQSGRVIVVILDSGVKGISKCAEDDEFDFEVGKRVAYLKARIKEMQKELKTY